LAKAQAAGDIEDLDKLHHVPCQQRACGALCHDPPARRLAIQGSGLVWVQPASLDDLIASLGQETRSYMLCFGNTSTGVYKTEQPEVKYDISSLPELQTITMTASTLVVGAGVTLANLIQALQAVRAAMSLHAFFCFSQPPSLPACRVAWRTE
jgi:xanthine dehydrogenase iron-sulfur cluster and FAD-binding subunit A